MRSFKWQSGMSLLCFRSSLTAAGVSTEVKGRRPRRVTQLGGGGDSGLGKEGAFLRGAAGGMLLGWHAVGIGGL